MENINNKSFNRFLIVWMGQLISSIGSGLTGFVLSTYAYQLTHTATSFTLVTLCNFVPSIVLRPIGGVLADRFDRRAMMILGDLGSALGLILIFIIMATGNIQLWQIYLGVTISSVFVALQSPAYKASTTDLVENEKFAKASGLVQLSSSAQYLLSPIIAGVLLGITDVKTILLIDITSFLMAIIAVVFIKKNVYSDKIAKEHQPMLKDMKEGWEAITANKGVYYLLIIISIVTFYIGFLQTLFGPMILSFSDSKTLGIAQSISAIGMLVSSVYVSTFLKTKKYTSMLVGGLCMGGIAFSLMGVTSNIYFIVISGFTFFFALTFINTSADVLVRKNIENEKQGRVWGIIGILSQLGFVIAYSISGVLADYVFNPLLRTDGLLANSVGKIIGIGDGRGIGLLFIVSGLFVVILGGVIFRSKSIYALNSNAVNE